MVCVFKVANLISKTTFLMFSLLIDWLPQKQSENCNTSFSLHKQHFGVGVICRVCPSATSWNTCPWCSLQNIATHTARCSAHVRVTQQQTGRVLVLSVGWSPLSRFTFFVFRSRLCLLRDPLLIHFFHFKCLVDISVQMYFSCIPPQALVNNN